MFKGLRSLALGAAAAIVIAMGTAPPAHAAEGTVHLVKRAGPEFDSLTSSSDLGVRQWIDSRFWRMMVFAPYFDDKTSWYQRGWGYLDLYSIKHDSDLARSHPEGILRDQGGRPLYIPWGCGGGTCPQYAADVTNAAFRAQFVAWARAMAAHGYKGIWLDDVNLEFRVGDGSGREVAPVDPRTGRPMTWEAWRKAVAEFVEQIRAALPASVEIVHNAIWYAARPARQDDPYVQREIRAADVVNLERGVNDDGLSGGNGEWSLNAFLAYVDRVHALGRSVVFDAYDGSAAGREYSLANYFLISTGRDGVGESHAAPGDWWRGWDVDLGAARGARTTWNGLLRRDFANGMVLVNEPDAPTRTIALPHAMWTADGRAVTSVTLAAKRGAVLVGAPPAAGAPAAAPVASSAATPAAKRATATRRAAKVRRSGHVVRVRGRLRAAAGDRARVELLRREHGRWRLVRRRATRLDRQGRFSARFAPLRPARYRAVLVARAA
jgi:Hypothetical glycosyl hydrolase family 15